MVITNFDRDATVIVIIYELRLIHRQQCCSVDINNSGCCHRHLRKVDLLMAITTCLVCLVSTVSGQCKDDLGKGCVSNEHITKLEQSTFL